MRKCGVGWYALQMVQILMRKDLVGGKRKSYGSRQVISLSHSKIFEPKNSINRDKDDIAYRKIYTPVVTHGCENWVLKNKQSRIQAAETKYSRRTLGIRKIRNARIRRQLGVVPVNN